MESNNFSPSINIIRDQEKELTYHVTPNSLRIANSIASQYKSTGHCFNLIGSYGTGKSSFLLALERDLKGEKSYFFNTTNVLDESLTSYYFINIIGGYQSLKTALDNELEIDSTKEPDNTIEQFHLFIKEKNKKGQIVVLVIDEYGKFLEYACNNNTDENIYFIQQVAECVNSNDLDCLMITSMHQNFNQYGAKLSGTSQNEWQKVNGRFIDITFNEPIEQLIYLSSQQVRLLQNSDNSIEKTEKANQVSIDSNLFLNKGTLDIETGRSLYPLDFASTYVLAKALQVYGQNERSLFTFLNKAEEGSLIEYIEKDKRYTLASLYNSLFDQYYSFIISGNNPYKSSWDSIRNALERIQNTGYSNELLLSEIVKTIGLLNIFASAGSRINSPFLTKYIDGYSSNEIMDAINFLEGNNIIRFRELTQKYILFGGTDLDFESELKKAKRKIDTNIQVANHIKSLYSFPYVYAKAISYQQGTPRIFGYDISDEPIDHFDQPQIDGLINLIFCKPKEVATTTLKCKTKKGLPILYGVFTKTKEIKNVIENIEKCRVVKEEHHEDRAAVKELDLMITTYEQELQKLVLENLGSKDSGIKWFVNGKEHKIETSRELNHTLSRICEKAYTETPHFVNELINKHKISTAISTARRYYLNALLKNLNQEDIGFAKDKFPAEKTIYMSLLKNSGIHRYAKDQWIVGKPKQDSNLYRLWCKTEEILDSTKDEKINLSIFYDELSKAPYKLKEGFLNFWIPTFLVLKQDDFALFNDKGYIPFITIEVLDLIHKKPSQFDVKAFSSNGIKLDLLNTYRDLIQKETKGEAKRGVYIDTIRPLIKFCRELPTFTQRSKRMSPSAIGFRNAILNAEDPETAFFEQIPSALGYSGLDLRSENVDLKDYLQQLKDAIRELRECESEMISEVEALLLKTMGFKKGEKFTVYKEQIDQRFSTLDRDLLLPHIKRLVNRLTAPVPKKTDWIKGLFSAVIVKGIDQMRDNDIALFINNFKKSYKDLERLVDIHKLNDTRKDKVVMIDIINQDGEAKKEHIAVSDFDTKKYESFDLALTNLFSEENKTEIDKQIMKQFLVRKLQEIL
ncbi:hypothetical protein K4L44_08680 [Halosquirtibacter laminarini]|uniref:Uncharacterized protein n=1 Tax=Halosquirtibacter laminarini TaxID=3374600 RepID=A0AC61NJG7_9BACT|nr:hypothetical protein K4L44_08680 [Prolixibacteraceae bacterium]